VKWLELKRRVDSVDSSVQFDGCYSWIDKNKVCIYLKGVTYRVPAHSKLLVRMEEDLTAGVQTVLEQCYPNKEDKIVYVNIYDLVSGVAEPEFHYGHSLPKEVVIPIETYLKTLPDFGEF
jgi:hypothetical protein